MNRSERQDVGQGAFSEVRPNVNQGLLEKNSFSRAVTPEFHGLWPEDYADVTEAQLAYVSTEFIRSSLLGASKDASNTIFYRNPLDQEVSWVAVTPLEHKQLGGNIEALGNRVLNNVLDSRPPRQDFANDKAAAARGGVHAVNRELLKLQTYREKTLARQTAAVRWLQHSAEHPGYAWKDGISVLMTMSTVRGEVFNDMITAMREAGSWTPEKTAGIEKVLTYKLFFDRKKNAHIGNWKEMLTLADDYLGYKKALYNTKIAKADRYIQKNDQPLQ